MHARTRQPSTRRPPLFQAGWPSAWSGRATRVSSSRLCPPARWATYEVVAAAPLDRADLLQHAKQDATLLVVELRQSGDIGVGQLCASHPAEHTSKSCERIVQRGYVGHRPLEVGVSIRPPLARRCSE